MHRKFYILYGHLLIEVNKVMGNSRRFPKNSLSFNRRFGKAADT